MFVAGREIMLPSTETPTETSPETPHQPVALLLPPSYLPNDDGNYLSHWGWIDEFILELYSRHKACQLAKQVLVFFLLDYSPAVVIITKISTHYQEFNKCIPANILFQTLHGNDGQQLDPAVRGVLLQAPENDGSS